MAVSRKEQVIRAFKKANKPLPKTRGLSAEYLTRIAALRCIEIDKLVSAQPIQSIFKMQNLNILPEYNQAGTMYKDVRPVLSVEGVMFSAITKERRVISRHTNQIDAFIAAQLNKRATKTLQGDGKRQPQQNAVVKAFSAKFQGLSVKVACGMLRQAYREDIAINPDDWQALHKQLDYEIELLREEQARVVKLPH